MSEAELQKIKTLKEAYLAILSTTENVNRSGLLDTPSRAAKAFLDLTAGYGENPYEIINSAKFKNYYGDEEIVVENIEFYSLCEHHMLPFFGTVTISYVPDNWILGLSKFARVVDVFAKRLQIQEKMTKHIGDVLYSGLGAKGVSVVVEAEHLCMRMRGCEKQSPKMKTKYAIGCYSKDNCENNCGVDRTCA